MSASLRTGAGAPRPGAASSQTIRFPVSGMTCGSCVNRITRALRRIDGVDRVRVDLGRELVTVRREPDLVDDTALASAIVAAGYEADLEAATVIPDTGTRGFLSRLFERS